MNTDWKKIYEERKVSAEEAVNKIPVSARMILGHAAGEPVSLVKAIEANIERFSGAEIVHMIALGSCKYCQPSYEKHIRHNSLFAGPSSRKAIKEGRADFTPVFFSEIPRLFKENILPVDVALIQVSLPDENGYCSYGVSVDYGKAAAESAKIVIAEINKQTPRTFGSSIHVSEIDFFVETDVPLLQIPNPEISDVEKRIAEHIASLVPDKANLQLGIGAIPDAVLTLLGNKKDLGIHTEMLSDGAIDLINAGIINSKYNNLHPGKFTACFLLGTRRLYDFVHENPYVNMQPVDYTNNVLIAAQVDNLISINSAIEVDLMGQVCADSVGSMQYSGVGGQLDFVRSASLSKGGKSIIAFASTAKNDTISKIVPKLTDGAAVTTSRNDVHFVVTEHGIADLRGKTLRQRAEALINIAHPNFRESLRKEAQV